MEPAVSPGSARKTGFCSQRLERTFDACFASLNCTDSNADDVTTKRVWENCARELQRAKNIEAFLVK